MKLPSRTGGAVPACRNGVVDFNVRIQPPHPDESGFPLLSRLVYAHNL